MPGSEVDPVAVALGATEGSSAGECVWSQIPRQSLWSLQRRIRLTLGGGGGGRCAKERLESGEKQDHRGKSEGLWWGEGVTWGPLGIRKGVSEEVQVELHFVRASAVQWKERGLRNQTGLGSNPHQPLPSERLWRLVPY